MNLFKLRGEVTPKENWVLFTIGVILIIALWWGIAEGFSEVTIASETNGVSRKIYPLLPSPGQVVSAFNPLITNDAIWHNTWVSIWLNIRGYMWALLVSVPLGFLIGLFPLFKGLFSKPVDALRYLPLSALTGLFILWFGIGDSMKIAFLAFGILVYLLPVVVQRVFEVDDVYVKTVLTLGAKPIQLIKNVFTPGVMSKLIDDIRVLTAISWTYIIIAELLNSTEGIGSLIYRKSRQGQIDKVFALLIVIVLVGFIQDRIFSYLDKRLFPFKHSSYLRDGSKEIKYGIYLVLSTVIFKMFQEIFFQDTSGTFGLIAITLLVSALLLIGYGEFKLSKSSSNA
jgi:NitT/TauT family transport system permease protein